MKVQIHASAPDSNGVKQPIGLSITNLPKNGDTLLLPSDAVERHKQFVELVDDGFLYHTMEGDVLFKIVREPGRYCLTCGERLPDHGGNGTMVEAKRTQQCLDHVATHIDPVVSDEWPHGYISRPRTYECKVEDRRQ